MPHRPHSHDPRRDDWIPLPTVRVPSRNDPGDVSELRSHLMDWHGAGDDTASADRSISALGDAHERMHAFRDTKVS